MTEALSRYKCECCIASNKMIALLVCDTYTNTDLPNCSYDKAILSDYRTIIYALLTQSRELAYIAVTHTNTAYELDYKGSSKPYGCIHSKRLGKNLFITRTVTAYGATGRGTYGTVFHLSLPSIANLTWTDVNKPKLNILVSDSDSD